MKGETLTKETLRKAVEIMESQSLPQKYYYVVHPNEWDDWLKHGWTEKQLTDYGFIKSESIPWEG